MELGQIVSLFNYNNNGNVDWAKLNYQSVELYV